MSKRNLLLFWLALIVITLGFWAVVITWTVKPSGPPLGVWLSGGDSPMSEGQAAIDHEASRPSVEFRGEMPGYAQRFCLTNDDCYVGRPDGSLCNSARQRCEP